MVIGMSLEAFTALHVLISMAAIAAGFVVVGSMIAANRTDGPAHVFLALTVATSVTGFAFPNLTLTPAVIFGVISVVALGAAYWARSSGRDKVYVIASVLALYLNSFVMVVQSFQKFPFLQSIAPTQSEAPFAVSQLVLLGATVYLGMRAVKGYAAAPAKPMARAAGA